MRKSLVCAARCSKVEIETTVTTGLILKEVNDFSRNFGGISFQIMYKGHGGCTETYGCDLRHSFSATYNS